MTTILPDVLDKIEREIRSGTYLIPNRLLRRIDPTIKLDAECLNYVRGIGGGDFYYQWLALLTRHLRPRLFLELGNRFGLSTIMTFSELSSDSRLISVDILRDQRYIPKEIWQDQRVRFVYGDCLDLSIYGDDIPIDVDILFTDTVHFYEQVRDEFDVYESLLADEALIIIDDIHVNDKGRFFEEAPYTKYNLTALCHGSGFGVLQFVRDPSRRHIQEARLRQAILASSRVWKRRYETLQEKVEDAERRRISTRLRQILRLGYSPLNYLLRLRKA